MDYYVINVYSPQASHLKMVLWNKLRSFISNHDGAFVLFGDFNVVKEASERFGSIFNESEANDFNTFIGDVGLVDLQLGDGRFTWVNKFATKMSRLDRSHFVQVFHSWFDAPGFDTMVRNTVLNEFDNNNSYHLSMKTVKLKKKDWVNIKRCQEVSRKQEVLNRINEVETNIENGVSNDEEKTERCNLVNELSSLQRIEVSDIMQKSQVKWDVEGDENSSFFHNLLKRRRSVQMVKGISLNDEWIMDPSAIKHAFLNSIQLSLIRLMHQLLASRLIPEGFLQAGDNMLLERNVTEDEEM
ncbi:uncharacterized protein [Rutidosis leptorrhynchoides]|uniref:uncharacterized protein n=1 Tax=Rutidosis leptorrhynchoides TaxID=125765 RepID=UPI003A99EA21